MIYLYEKDFINLLNLINYLLKNKIEPLNIKDIDYMPNLFEKTYFKNIELDNNLIDRIINKIGYYAFRVIYYVYLSDKKDKELLIYKFLSVSLKYKSKVCYQRNIDVVSDCLKISKYVKCEAHKFKGFIRFKDLNGVLYSEMEPENNILLILSNHFKNRLKNEYWIIKDKKRNIISIYNKKDFYITSSNDIDIKINLKDDYYEEMWKSFYKTVAIKERKNDRCRMNFMPKKYWKYIMNKYIPKYTFIHGNSPQSFTNMFV